MRNLKIIGAIATLFVTGSGAWQISVRELANVELRDDMHDMTSQVGARIGLMNRRSDDDFRIDVIGQARKYDIQLKPEQVTVERRGEGVEATIYLAADYRVPISLPGFSFQLHFNAESGPRPD